MAEPHLESLDQRRQVKPPGNGNGSGGDTRERLARLETKVENIEQNMARQVDISNLKVWVLGGALATLLGVIGIAATVVTVLIRTLGSGAVP